MRRAKVDLTADDVIALLKNTHLPTLIIEGDLDAILFRRFEEVNSAAGVSVLPVGGRTCLLEIFKRRQEFAGRRVVFFADRDAWVYSAIPSEYMHAELIFTDGYSIENDAYVDGSFEKYLSFAEDVSFRKELATFIYWYALALNRSLQGKNASFSLHPSQVIGPQYAALTQMEQAETYPVQLRDQIAADYQRLLRGKSLLKLLLLQIGHSGRAARHSAEALTEFAANVPGGLIDGAFARIRALLTT